MSDDLNVSQTKRPQERQQILLKRYQGIQNWEERYKKIIEQGKQLAAMPEKYRINENLIKGCQSQVWLFVEKQNDGQLKFFADSDALITKGLVALILEIYSEATPADILQTSPDFIKELGFYENLSPSRANGLIAMLKQIKLYAMAMS